MTVRQRILSFLYRQPHGFWLFRRCANRWEGGEMWSETWRGLLASVHDVHVGRYSYGPILRRGLMPRGTRVGDWCSVGRDLIVRRRNHPIERVTQHPFFYHGDFGVIDQNSTEPNEANPLVIGHDVWIGDRVTILSDCRHIGNGAVIAAGAVVTKDVAPYAIVGGVPARPLRDRFPPEIQAHLEAARWWELRPDALAQVRPMLLRPLTEAGAAEFAAACARLRADKAQPRTN